MSSPSLWDRLGIGLSLACLAHCLLVPLALAGLSVWAAADAVHVGFALVLVPIAVLAGWRGYVRHRHPYVPVLLGGGAVLLLGALALESTFGAAAHVGLTVIGGVLLIAGHGLNFRLRPRCA